MAQPSNPPPPERTIPDLLSRLASRQRRLLVVQAAAAGVAGVGLALIAAAVLLSVGAPRVAVIVGTSVLGVGGLGAAIWLVAGSGWTAAGTHLWQARRVEAHRPALRGALLSALAHQELLGEPAKPAPRGVSRVLVARAARNAAAAIADVRPDVIHPPRPAQIALAGALVVVLGVLVADRTLPVGPFDAIAVAFGGSAAEARLERAAAPVSGDRAVVGDIVLRYVYPDYTGIDPVEVPNSDGTIHAPPGTTVQITARTAEPFDAAALQVDDGAVVDATLAGGRALSTSLLVEGAGTWRFVLFVGSEVELSPDYEIVVEADAPPVVALKGAAPATAPRDRSLRIEWSAQDDFGVERVVLEVERADGTIDEHPLRTPLDARLQLAGGVPLTPSQLDIPAGETVKMRVVAYDNDHLEGSKRGVSPDVEMMVVGPKGQGHLLTGHYRRLRNALIPVLAAFLTDEMLPASTPSGMTRWVVASRDRLTPARDLQDAQWKGQASTGIDSVLMGEVMDSSARLFRFALTTWQQGTKRRVTDSDVQSFLDLHGEAVVDLERAIITLDQLLQNAAKKELAETLETLANQAQQLAAIAENAEAGELLARLDQLERMLGQFAQLAEQLNEGALKEYVNPRIDEARNMVDQIREAIKEGRLDDARELMQQMAEELEQMSESMNSQMASQQQGEDELGEQFKQTMAELEALEQEQKDLAEAVQQARQEMGQGIEDLVALWAKVDALAEKTRARSDDLVEGVGDGTGWRADSIRWFEKLGQRSAGIQDAVRARNASSALERVVARATAQAIGMSTRLLASERDRRRPPAEAAPDGIGNGMEAVSDVQRSLDEMAELLEQLVERQQEESPEVQQAAREMSAQQQALKERGDQIAGDVKRIELAMPTADGTGSDAMEAAGAAMERAGESLGEGDAMEGEGHGRSAARRLREAQDALNRQMQRHQQMQQAMQKMQGEQEGEQKEGGEEDGQSMRDKPFEMPMPESFQTPEEYRRGLLEGMEGDVPDEYEALKLRYFEELVRQ